MKTLLCFFLLATIAFADKAIFTTTLPPAIEGKTDLWVAKFNPTKEEPSGGLFVVPRHSLGNYAAARARGYLWSWAPLTEVFDLLDGTATVPVPVPVPVPDAALKAENEALKKRIRDAVVILGVGAL